ncbi:hypothetical protein GPX89_13610 [Nocardia sp. ET3-3]|uniref:Integral membrane protein n=1 Tax=Nocardia terrae TaxID=2675851 RepID=A0A7K1UVE0_9NOCA|nr:hypothetical protein [Nocardia terrae]MVU78277.1 hypothetical protein [Nocardia terrae]
MNAVLAPRNPRRSTRIARRSETKPTTGRALRVAVRTVATLTAADALIQAALAGRFLAGNFDALGLHAANTSVLAALTVTLLAVVAVRSRRERGPWWPAAAVLALVATEGLQAWLAQLDYLELHVPLGVGIIASLILVTRWAWREADSREPEFPSRSTSAPATTSGAEAQ